VAGSPSVGSVVLGDVVDAVGEAGGDVDAGGLEDAGPVGVGEPLVADAEGDVLVGGADCVGVGDCRPLDVGLALPVAVGDFDAVSRLVPVPSPPTAVAGTEAVVGVPAVWVDRPVDVGFGVCPGLPAPVLTLLVSRIAMTAMIPQAATPTPASRSPRRCGREPP
jgi:hypothetical protein